MKPCAKCGSTGNGYTKDKRTTDGLNSWCKLCTQAASRKWVQENPEKQLRRTRIWNTNNRERVNKLARDWSARNRERAREICREYRRRHPEKSATYQRNNPDRVRVYGDRYRKANPEKTYTKARNRRARIRQAAGTHTAQDVLNLLENQNGLCAGCGCNISSGYHVDHIVALVNGGSNWPENLQLLCPPCNMKKGMKSQSEFLALIRKAA